MGAHLVILNRRRCVLLHFWILDRSLRSAVLMLKVLAKVGDISGNKEDSTVRFSMHCKGNIGPSDNIQFVFHFLIITNITTFITIWVYLISWHH